jgi:hypothetical protein
MAQFPDLKEKNRYLSNNAYILIFSNEEKGLDIDGINIHYKLQPFHFKL